MPVGVDEAGKGPVLGSMFAAAIRVPDPGVLPDGIRDSKTISPERRESLARALRDADRVEIAVCELPPERIDDPRTDMNTLTVDAHAAALADLARDGDAVLADAADVDAARFARRLADRVPAAVDVSAEHGADETDPVVAAASIVAKVARDEHVDDLAVAYGSIGSGYPSDPATRSFLESFVAEHGELPACARRSWQTCADVLAAVTQSGLEEF